MYNYRLSDVETSGTGVWVGGNQMYTSSIPLIELPYTNIYDYLQKNKKQKKNIACAQHVNTSVT